jgi:hypothetical protein
VRTRLALLLVAPAVLGLALACTVDEVVGSTSLADAGFDAGSPICPGTGVGCDPVCGAQLCRAGCSGLSDCVITCSGTSCSFECDRPEGLTCTPTCEPGPCTMSCTPTGEESISCTMNCSPPQICAADCHGGTCKVACGQLEPATICDAGVYSCSDRCP